MSRVLIPCVLHMVSIPNVPPQHCVTTQEELGKVSRLAAAAKAKLEALERDNEAARKRPGQGVGSASERSRTTITAGLKRKLKELCEGFMEFRNQITAEYQDVVAKRVYAVTGGASSCGGTRRQGAGGMVTRRKRGTGRWHQLGQPR